MKISEIYVNHMHHPVGFELKDLRIEFSIEAESFRKIQKCLIIYANGSEVMNTGFSEYDNNFFTPELELNPRTHYDVEIRIRDEKEETSARTFFETGKMDEPFLAKWIGNDDKDIQNTVFEKDFNWMDKLKRHVSMPQDSAFMKPVLTEKRLATNISHQVARTTGNGFRFRPTTLRKC